MSDILIFGASGDISNKKVLPGLFEWFLDNLNNLDNQKDNLDNQKDNLDEIIFNKIIGYGRTSITEEDFRKKIVNNKNIPIRLISEKVSFSEKTTYIQGQYDKIEGFNTIFNYLQEYKTEKTPLILYFGVPSSLAPKIIRQVVDSKMDEFYDCKYILEKPIGTNLEDAKNILDEIDNMIDDSKLFILDHYLAKTNIFENKINPETNDISTLKIYLNETIDVENRLEYFDKYGLFKDMVQSHVLTLIDFYCPNLFSNINLADIKITDARLGQYKGYGGNKKTETLVQINLVWDYINIYIDTSKKDNVNKKYILCKSISDKESIKTKIIKITSKESEYKILFQDSLKNDKSKFLKKSNIFDFWKISDYIWEQIKHNEINIY